jgi:hypothetical protein
LANDTSARPNAKAYVDYAPARSTEAHNQETLSITGYWAPQAQY